MKIAFDIHGTIARNPETFKPMMEAFVKGGNSIYIISGPPADDIFKELTKLGYECNKHYHIIHSVVDYIQNHTATEMTQDGKGHWWCDEKTWWKAKGWICHKYSMDMIIDNDIRYKDNMPSFTTFILWEGCDG
jgi:hypothetical protein